MQLCTVPLTAIINRNQGCYAMALIWLMIHESSYLDSTLLVSPTLRQPIGYVIQVVGRHWRLGKKGIQTENFLPLCHRRAPLVGTGHA